MKPQFIFNDMLIFEEFCNSQCKYCGGFYPTEFKLDLDSCGRIKMPELWKHMLRNNPKIAQKISTRPKIKDFFNLAVDILSEVDKKIDYPILKISGGEIFLYKDILEFVKKIHKKYSAVQLLTNAIALTSEKINQLARLDNVYFQISLDGVTSSTNTARTSNETIIKRILENTKRIMNLRIGLEINCVLTKYNTAKFGKMLKFFGTKNNLMIVPRPVRGEPREILDFTSEQINLFKNFIKNNYSEYESILPPIAYFNRMIDIIENKKRGFNCYVPFFVFGENNYGDVSTCTCTNNLPLLGNIFTDGKAIADLLRKRGNYLPDSRLKPCSYCITQYEMMNLYVDGLIGKNDLLKTPSYRFPGVLEMIDKIKNELICHGIVR